MTKKRLNDPSVTDRMISEFIWQCPCCQVMSRLRIPIKTHPFTCASYNPFEVLHLDHFGPLRPDEKGNLFILVIIYAGGTLPHQDNNCSRIGVVHIPALRSLRQRRGSPHGSGHCLPQRVDRRIAPDVGNRTFIDYRESNQEVLRHLNAILFDSRVHDRWYRR